MGLGRNVYRVCVGVRSCGFHADRAVVERIAADGISCPIGPHYMSTCTPCF